MKTIITVLMLIILFPSCKKGSEIPLPPFNTEYELQNRPEALAVYDGANYGIYKGVVINAQDSTATFKVNLYNNHPQPYALFYRNHTVQDSLIRYLKDNTGNLLIPQKADTATVPFNNSFYYTYFSSYSIGQGSALVGFNVAAYGTSYHMDTRLYGNATLNAVLKEKSNNQVFCYEGSYSGSDSGRIAFAMSTDSVVAIRASVWNPQFFKVASSHVNGNSFTFQQVDDVSGNTFTFTGTIQNNSCMGTWIKSTVPSVVNQFKTVRTL